MSCAARPPPWWWTSSSSGLRGSSSITTALQRPCEAVAGFGDVLVRCPEPVVDTSRQWLAPFCGGKSPSTPTSGQLPARRCRRRPHRCVLESSTAREWSGAWDRYAPSGVPIRGRNLSIRPGAGETLSVERGRRRGIVLARPPVAITGGRRPTALVAATGRKAIGAEATVQSAFLGGRGPQGLGRSGSRCGWWRSRGPGAGGRRAGSAGSTRGHRGGIRL